jgi:hypothetical protein
VFAVIDLALLSWSEMFELVNICQDVFAVLNAAGFYFRACTPLPPQKSWARKAVEKAKTVWSGVTEPIPVPVET